MANTYTQEEVKHFSDWRLCREWGNEAAKKLATGTLSDYGNLVNNEIKRRLEQRKDADDVQR